jgi:DNA-binding NarL/FixJ family response regulator
MKLISELISSENHFEIVSTAANGLDFVLDYNQYADKIDFILLDLNMPGINGLEVLNKIISRYKNIKVIIFYQYLFNIIQYNN